MTILQALKRIRYPHGKKAKEYMPGDKFEALSERDVKALTLLRVAKALEPQPQPKMRVADPERKVRVMKPVKSKAEETESAGVYSRRDMRAEDE